MAKPTLEQSIAVAGLVTRWQAAAHADHAAKGFTHPLGDVTRCTTGGKFFHLVIGSSSAFLVDIVTGTIYGNKGWLVVDRKKVIGNAYDPNFNAAVLIRDRFRWGTFENNPDGSLRQPIVRR